ncbi:hypothetical protein ANCCEY_03144 [Ancylostoma ceylanicum]|uniref:Uncharacterized protein n=1 Tax=Ancylostoma ceylanicum TaxID=53326 RepID=A0A0D6M5W2_9BILA|nr:hypothetical protein ANCCEY_03144 [Ancylostoma ceylanicum]
MPLTGGVNRQGTRMLKQLLGETCKTNPIPYMDNYQQKHGCLMDIFVLVIGACMGKLRFQRCGVEDKITAARAIYDPLLLPTIRPVVHSLPVTGALRRIGENRATTRKTPTSAFGNMATRKKKKMSVYTGHEVYCRLHCDMEYPPNATTASTVHNIHLSNRVGSIFFLLFLGGYYFYVNIFHKDLVIEPLELHVRSETKEEFA